MAVTESTEFPEPVASAEAPQPAGEIVNGAQVNPEPAPAEPIAAQPEPDLATLLKEYDEQMRPSPLGQEAAQPEQQTEPNELEKLIADLEQQPPQQVAPADPLAAERDQLKQQLAEAQHRETVQRDMTDLEEVEAALDKDIREQFPDMPRGYVRMYLYAMAAASPEATRVFDRRYENPAAFKALYSNISKELYRLARERPDRELTENRLLVTHAVRGASSGNVEMKEPAPDYSSMSDQEFRQEVRKLGIAPAT
jgi:hypothetical protein